MKKIKRVLRGLKLISRQTRMEKSLPEAVEVERASKLHVYLLNKQLNDTIAISRYVMYDETGKRVLDVVEDAYDHSPGEAERLEDDVCAAIEIGVDVTVLTGEDMRIFPRLHSIMPK